MNTNLFDALRMIGEGLLLALFTLFRNPVQHTTPEEISFSRRLNKANQGRVRDVLIHGFGIRGVFTEGRTF
jgi:hypothetical protein